MMQEENHIFQGMRRDNHEIKQDSKFLWDAHNIRLTNRDDNTLFSITNEKGTLDTGVSFEGEYVGHCVLGKYLVVFTAKGNTSYIYRVEKSDNSFSVTTLYDKDALGLSPKHPIETLGIFENEEIQKVYWIDSEHQPRVINIVQDTYTGSFDFVQDLKLEEIITVERDTGGGVFSPGVIQYAFSYYNKYGAETNLFYTTELLYISANNRGGSPEEVIDNIFKITIENIDTNFQYLRVYSIHRTSIDAVPTVKIVEDINIKDIGKERTLTYIDTGRIGTTEDPTKLLYIGGEHIIAGTFTHKDGTLFLGNIKIERQEVGEEIKTSIKTKENSQVTIGKREFKLIKEENTYSKATFYNYDNQLLSGKCSTFKVGDKYRLGIQFQYKNGKWSTPVWIEDKTIPREKANRPSISNGLNLLTLPQLTYNLSSDLIQQLTAIGYKKARALVVLPTVYERMTLAQGVVCPTVFSASNRVLNAPFAQSSWFFRPMSTSTEVDLTKGTKIAHKHFDPLYFNPDPNKVYPRGLEIQNMETIKNSKPISLEQLNRGENITASDVNTMFVDQSILTLHSPDIEFDDSVKLALDNKEMDLYLVGLTPFTSNVGDISIKTSTPPPGTDDTGFLHKTTFVIDNVNGVDTSLTSGLFYLSHMIEEKDGKYTPFNDEGGDSYKYEYNWLVHPWNRSGSLINDITRPEGGGTQTAKLERKVISNLKYSQDNVWLDEIYNPVKGITPVQIFNSNEVSLIKIPSPDISKFKYDGINYYGNVDSLITTDTKYPLYYSEKDAEDPNILNPTAQNPTADGNTKVQAFTSPVRVKYKSTPHAVFAFNYNNASLPLFLPSIGNLNKANVLNVNTTPYWLQPSEDVGITALDKEYDKYSATDYTIIRDSAQYGNVGTKGVNTSQEDQDKYNKDWLKNRPDKYIDKSKWAIMTSTIAVSGDYTYGDFYKYISGNNEWIRCDHGLGGEVQGGPGDKKVYYISGHNSYWEKIYVGTGYTMKQIIVTGDTDNPGSDLENQIVYQPDIPFNPADTEITEASLFLAELVRKEEPANMFGGNTTQALQSNLWIPAGNPVTLTLEEGKTSIPIDFIYGDTYYQRYDCLKTYPFTIEDENSVVEIGSFMCETRVNIDGRYDKNRAQLSNLNMSPLNFNLLNNVYSQRDNYFNYRILPEDFYKLNAFPNQITWSKEKHAGEDIDTWAHITLANTLDMDGSKGKVTALKSWNEYLMCFQEKALSQILFNSRTQIPVSDGVPIEISNGYKVDGSRLFTGTIGCNNKWSIINTTTGIYFADSNTNNLYLFNGQLTNLSQDRGMNWWARENNVNALWKPIPYVNNGLRTFYDSKYGDIYFTPGPKLGITLNSNDALCYSEQLGQFTSLMSYGDTQAMFNFADGFYSLRESDGNLKLYQNNVGEYNNFFGEYKGWDFSFISNDKPLVTKIFDTVELRADHYNTYQIKSLLYDCPVSFIKAQNEYQNGEANTPSGKAKIRNKNMMNKFRIWRGIIPRHNGTMQRIRNPWAMITLGWKPKSINDIAKELPSDATREKIDAAYHEYNTKEVMVHDVSVKYTI